MRGLTLGTLRSRLFWKLFASYGLLVVSTAATIGALEHRRVRDSSQEGLERTLRAQCVLLRFHAGRPSHGGGLREEVRELARDTGLRITLIDPEGRVVADSEADAADMENHASWAEVVAARESPDGFGAWRRLSTTAEREMLYVAHAVRRDGELVGVVRVALFLDELDRRLASSLRQVLFGVLAGAIVALVLGFYVAGRFAGPVTEMRTAAEQLSRGSYGTRIRDLPNDEVGALGAALNRLGDEVVRHIASVSRDSAQLRAMLVGMAEGVVAVDDDDEVIFSNRAARDLLGLEPGDHRGRKLWEVVRMPELSKLIESARPTDLPRRRELVVAHENGERVLVARANRFATEDTGGVVVVFDDTTDLRRLERIRRDFVANVSHELKTPLTSIRGFVETLLDGALDDRENHERFLTKIQDNVLRLNHLVSDLLSLARIEQQHEVQRERVDWRHVVTQAARRHESDARKGGVDCLVEAPADPVEVLGDAESLTQIVDNLLSNAIKYTPDGGRVDVVLATGHASAILEVRDTGIGIPREDLGRIFERFYRVDKARSRELGGTGLGLSIVKNLVQGLGGSVAVDSEFGSGSTFRVTLPLAG